MAEAAVKPIVKYRGQAVPYLVFAILCPLDHPNRLEGQDVSNGRTARTSRVLSWRKDGVIETVNTIYVPEEPQ